jgi:hypothetical protein
VGEGSGVSEIVGSGEGVAGAVAVAVFVSDWNEVSDVADPIPRSTNTARIKTRFLVLKPINQFQMRLNILALL